MCLVTDSLETNDIQGDVGFLGTDCHELKKEFSVVSDQKGQHPWGGAIGVDLT